MKRCAGWNRVSRNVTAPTSADQSRSIARSAARRSAFRSAGAKGGRTEIRSKAVKIENFFAELKRRNVYKVAVAYAVVAWLLIQAASILLPTFEAPTWVMKVLV